MSSKKRKQNLQQKIAKKQQLQQLAQNNLVSFESAPATPSEVKAVELSPKANPSHDRSIPHRATRELIKTAVSIVLIAILLTGVVIFDRKTPYLNRFGDKLYATLKLQS